MEYLKDIKEDGTVYLFITTLNKTGSNVAPSTALEAADAIIYKNGSATQKTTTNGMTMTSPFDSVVGFHLLEIDTSNDTGDAGFWEAGNTYTVLIDPDETVDGETPIASFQFSIEDNSQFDLVARGICGASSSTTLLNNLTGPVSTETTDNHWRYRTAQFTSGNLKGQMANITASDGGTPKTITVEELTESPASGDHFVVL